MQSLPLLSICTLFLSLFNHSTSPAKPLAVKTQDFCSCSGLKSLNETRRSCPPSTTYRLVTKLQDITERIIDKQQILLKGLGLTRKPDLEHDETLQADRPSQSLSYKRREEICHKILNASDSLRVCKNIVGEELWQKIWQICVEETQVKLLHFATKLGCYYSSKHLQCVHGS